MTREQKEHIVYLGLGANLGNREETIQRAVTLIGERIGPVERLSSFYYSEPWGFASANSFVNAVAKVSTALSPLRLLNATQRIERDLGKRTEHATQRQCSTLNAQPSTFNVQRSMFNVQCPTFNVQCSTFNVQCPTYHDRPIDIDILLYDDLRLDTPKLKIPHPLMRERDFVMVPLREICPTYADPEPSR